ncbi:hypothetical protein V6C32_06350 [Desulforamulus ruminis]|uniref:Uncharacterized protein n=1 Tax=Desulforamulus ruminis (strain ATCC 23193 / DSM 2154 / NCIMB 8452 / DL) TaxID=696281 RepID=F6DU45_DESRL|nr:hypothetical protein [Desulforamulus ruminis]AEG60120.1 hypothetical protein Desru_1859 [Desulforamulus ruminis DSM 2154]
MVGGAKCGKCVYKEQCDIRHHLNEIIKTAIEKAESYVKELAPREIDYMIVTDISVIPTRCERFRCIEESPEKDLGRNEESLFILGRRLAPTAI